MMMTQDEKLEKLALAWHEINKSKDYVTLSLYDYKLEKFQEDMIRKINYNFFRSCDEGNLTHVKYFLEKNETVVPPDIFYEYGSCFVVAFQKNHEAVSAYLIDYVNHHCQEKLNEVENFANKAKNSFVIQYFNSLKEKNKLEKLLDEPQKTYPKKFKV